MKLHDKVEDQPLGPNDAEPNRDDALVPDIIITLIFFLYFHNESKPLFIINTIFFFGKF